MNDNTVDQEDAIRDVIDKKIEEVCRQLLQWCVDSHVILQASARGHLIRGHHKRAVRIQVYWRRYLARKLFRSMLLLRREEEDDEIIVTFVDDDDDNDDGIPSANENCAWYTVLGKEDLTDHFLDKNGVMRKAVTDIMMSILKNQESLESNELQVLGCLLEVGFNGNKKDDKRLKVKAIRVKGSYCSNPFEVICIPWLYKQSNKDG